MKGSKQRVHRAVLATVQSLPASNSKFTLETLRQRSTGRAAPFDWLVLVKKQRGFLHW